MQWDGENYWKNSVMNLSMKKVLFQTLNSTTVLLTNDRENKTKIDNIVYTMKVSRYNWVILWKMHTVYLHTKNMAFTANITT